MLKTPNEQLEVLTLVAAAKLTGLDRFTLSRAMDQYSQTNGRRGLAFVQPYGRRRMVRRSSLRDWFERQEASARYGY